MKGNSAYGSTIMDQEKFQCIKYVQGEGYAMIDANKPQLKKLTAILEKDEYFEVEKAKEKLDMNLSIQIGYSTPNWEFYHSTKTFLSVHRALRTVRWTPIPLTWPYSDQTMLPLLNRKYKAHVKNDWCTRTCCSTHSISIRELRDYIQRRKRRRRHDWFLFEDI